MKPAIGYTALLDFCAVTDHDFGIALYNPEKNWDAMLEAAGDFLEPGRFVTIPGWEVIHNGEVVYTWRGAGEQDVRLEFEHNESMTGLPAAPDWGYYYVRVIQEGEGMAWSSPIWVRLPQS